MGVHVLTLTSVVVKHTTVGQPSEDSATCARDADPQEAGLLDTYQKGKPVIGEDET